jgi:signal peptidase I
VTSGLSDIGRALRLPESAGVTWRQLTMALVPGLPQIRAESAGLQFLGWSILGLWGSVLLIAVAFLGSGFSTLMAFACVSIHCFSISLLLTPQLQGTPLAFRLIAGVSVYIVVLLGLYWPASIGLRQIAQVLPINGLRSRTTLANGDILLYTGRWTRPSQWHRGDLVVVSLGGANYANAYVRGGFNVDRIIAGPGDFVRIAKGVLSVNGEAPPPEFSPIGPVADLPDAELDVAPGTYVVLPSVLPWLAHGNVGDQRIRMLWNAAVIPEDEIRGRVLLRVRPWTRFGYPDGGQQ